jgi:hypothetical protein
MVTPAVIAVSENTVTATPAVIAAREDTIPTFLSFVGFILLPHF